jgi:asparagine synthase (glutamine-hydrolysing)
MSGILGLTHPESFPYLRPMAELIRHRGPDDYGEHIDKAAGVALATRRLSVVDLAGGRQPMSNEDGSMWIVFNGEIYNAPELRRRLLARGHRFQSDHCDTEVVVHLFEDKGPAMLEELNGMFAFVIYDVRRRRLFAARDRSGIKPLYYSHRGGRFAFASELKCLRLLPWISSAVNPQSLYDYLSLQFVPGPSSILHDVQKLPAGHFLEYYLSCNRLTVRRYWSLQPQAKSNRDAAEWVQAVRTQLAKSVQRQTLSDAPIACSLSGGLKSATVVGLLRQWTNRPLKTYALGFADNDEASANVLPQARAVAEKLGTEHHEIVIDPGRVLADLERMVWHLDEPYGGSLPSWYVFERIGRDCKVALSGTGGDELFGHRAQWLIHQRSRLYRTLCSLRDACRWRRPRELLDGLRYPHGHFYHRCFADAVKESLVLSPTILEGRTGTEAVMERFWRETGGADVRDSVAVLDFQLQLPEDVLAVTDRFSMAHSVEARVPFLDHDLVELVFTIPPDIRTPAGDPTYLLRQAVAGFLPPELSTASKKGSVLPLLAWTRGPLRELIGDLVGPGALRRQALFAPTAWSRIVEPHLSGKHDLTQPVWTLLMFQLWARQSQAAATSPVRPAMAA